MMANQPTFELRNEAHRIRTRVPDAVLSEELVKGGIAGVNTLLDKQGATLASDEDR